MDYLAGAEILIHNAAFDVGFLNAELKRLAAGVRGAGQDDHRHAADGARDVPGKSNSLDALCKRLEVDNASRSLHGALLDAGLLAEVYIRMTRGQDSLVIDEVEAALRRRGGAGERRPVGLRAAGARPPTRQVEVGWCARR